MYSLSEPPTSQDGSISTTTTTKFVSEATRGGRVSRARVRLARQAGVGRTNVRARKPFAYVTLIVHLEVKYALKVRANVDDATSACDACASKRLVRPVSLCVRVEFFCLSPRRCLYYSSMRLQRYRAVLVRARRRGRRHSRAVDSGLIPVGICGECWWRFLGCSK